MTGWPKPVKRSTAKRHKHEQKAENIRLVRGVVAERDDWCRITKALRAFGFTLNRGYKRELAHLDGRGMGGNRDLSRDTTGNTIFAIDVLHQGPRSMHSGHIKVAAMTNKGADGPVAITFYEKLPTEIS